MASEVQHLVDAVERSRTALLAMVSALVVIQKPSPDEWSVAEILEHLYLAELGGITKIWAALDGVRAGKVWDGHLPNRGRTIEEVVAATWKPKEMAPAVAAPHFGGPLAAWVAALRSLQPLLRDLATALEGHDLDAIVYPHALSGPLDARQRLQFLRFHIDRHIGQIQRVQARSAGAVSESR